MPTVRKPKTTAVKAPKKATIKKATRPKLETDEALFDLTPEEVSALSKPREGFEAHIEGLLALYEAEADELKIRGLELAEIRAHANSAKALAAIEAAAAKYAEMVRETRLLHAARVWDALLDIYAKAQAVGRTNEAVARGIADFAKFMKTGPRKAKAEKTPG